MASAALVLLSWLIKHHPIFLGVSHATYCGYLRTLQVTYRAPGFITLCNSLIDLDGSFQKIDCMYS